MADHLQDKLSLWMERRLLARWDAIAERAETQGLTTAERDRAMALRRKAENALRASETSRGAVPQLPPHADWWWRPDVWCHALCPAGLAASGSETAFSPDLSVFHDCPEGEISVRQARNLIDLSSGDFGLDIDVYRFSGSYLSLVFELPTEVAHGLRKRHVIRLRTELSTERPAEVLARLNIRHGPNTERIVRDLNLGETEQTVDFDLAVTRVDPARTERMWLDLIFERPNMNGLNIADLVLSRQPRAEV
jgi:hypothetical protein